MTTTQTHISGSRAVTSRLRLNLPAPLRLFASVIVAGLVSAVLVYKVPRQLHVTTDIVGYPTYANFNIERILDWYYIVIVFFPLFALLLYVIQTNAGVRLGLVRPQRTTSDRAAVAPEDDGALSGTRQLALAIVRSLVVGASFGLAIAIAENAAGDRFWAWLAWPSLVYTAALVLAGWWTIRHSAARDLLATSMARLNSLAIPLVFLTAWWAISTTTLTVVSDGAVYHYAWLPWWLALLFALGVGALIWRALSHARGDAGVKAVERNAILFVTAPVVLFLLLSNLQGALGPIDAFHEGEALVAAKLTVGGAFYWRDLLTTHGPFQDVLMPLVGMNLLDNNRWGYMSGYPLLLTPLAFVSLYLLSAWLFRRSWAFVTAVVVVFLSLQFVEPDPRFMFWPLILLLLGASLSFDRTWLFGIVGACLVAQAVIVPESAYCIAACGVIVIAYDLTHRRARGFRETFNRTIWLSSGGAALFVVFALFLASQHALYDFIFYYVIFVPGHDLTGGLSIHLRAFGPLFIVQVLAPPLAFLLGFFYFAKAVVERRALDVRDWVIAADGLFAVVYYTKYLARADIGHGWQASAAAVPLILYVGFKAVRGIDLDLYHRYGLARISGTVSRQPVAIMLLAATLYSVGTMNAFHTAPPLLAYVSDTPERFHRTAPDEPQLAHVGFAENAIDPATVADMGSIFQTYLQPGDWVFDFSNQPALIYYLLDLQPKIRYYHVTMADTDRAQQDLISELKRNPPKLVVFTDDTYGLLNWDGIPNMVRHYDVSQYILDNYTPLLATHTQIIYARTSDHLSASAAQSLSLEQPIDTQGLPFKGFMCDWGYAPNFLSVPAPPQTKLAPVSLSYASDPNASVSFDGWAGDTSAGTAVSRVVVTNGTDVIEEATPTIARPDVALVTGTPGFGTSGYRISVAVPDSGSSLTSTMHVLGVSANGIASELLGSPAAGLQPLSQIRFPDGTSVPVKSGQVTGSVDITNVDHQLDITLPAGTAWPDYRWLEIDTSSKFAQDRWAIYDDQSGDPGHQIIFRTLPGAASGFRVYVGSCAQWHGYQATQLFLGHGQAEDITGLRLIP